MTATETDVLRSSERPNFTGFGKIGKAERDSDHLYVKRQVRQLWQALHDITKLRPNQYRQQKRHRTGTLHS